MNAITHDGDFHADEVFAIATLELVVERNGSELRLRRSRDPQLVAAADIRVDIGGEHDPARSSFDHHQSGGAGSRDNGIDYASFGLVWKQFGPALCGDDGELCRRVDRSLVQWVDANDNGQSVAASKLPDHATAIGLGGLIAAFNPRWNDAQQPEAFDERFAEAVAFARGIIERELGSALALLEARALVREAIDSSADPRVIELDRKLPWREAVSEDAPSALFVIYPRASDWGLQAVPVTAGEFDNRLDLPAAWAGLADSELAAVTGVADAIFAHRARFFAAAGSREGVLELARLALDAGGASDG